MKLPDYNLHEAISYRLISFVITFTVTFYVTGSMKAAIAIGPVDQVIKFFIYYYHRRAWSDFSARKVTEYLAEGDTNAL